MLHKILVPGMAEDAADDGGPMRYDQYGVRVPAVIVSPYARPDFVLSDVLDHTSVLKLVEEKWNLPALTRRDAGVLSPLGALGSRGRARLPAAARAAGAEPEMERLVAEVYRRPGNWTSMNP